jgi:anti-anti-sigma factor
MLMRNARSEPASLDALVVNRDFLVVRFGDQSLLEAENVESTGARLNQIVEQHWQPRIMLLNFSQIEHMDSMFLGTLIVLHERLKGEDRRLVLCHLAPHIDEAMYLTRLDLILDIWDSEQSALEELGRLNSV